MSVGWELLERREIARTRMCGWKSAGSIVDYILEMAVLAGKMPECGTELSSVETVRKEVHKVNDPVLQNPDVLDDDVWDCPDGLSHCQESRTVLADGGAECGEILGQSQDCLSVTDITMLELEGDGTRSTCRVIWSVVLDSES